MNDTNKLGADLLVVMGRWVYDAGHNNEGHGWNEIHAIKLCERIGRWDGAWPPDIEDQEKKWAGAIGEATSALTAAAQLDLFTFSDAPVFEKLNLLRTELT